MKELLSTEYCPKCHCSVYVPGRHWGGGELPQPYKSCSCSPADQPAADYPNESPAVQQLALDVVILQKWVGLLTRLIPQGNGPIQSVPWIPEDIHDHEVAFPPHVLEQILADGDKELRRSNKIGTIYVDVCKYCGHLSVSYVNALTGAPNTTLFHGFRLCEGCKLVKSGAPEIFRWVSKIIRFGYVRAPSQPMPIMPPTPPAPLPEAIKVITLDE